MPRRELGERAALTEALVRTRKSLWCALVPAARVSLLMERVEDLREVVRGTTDHGWDALVDALTRTPAQHRIAASITRVAESLDEAWTARIHEASASYRAARDRVVRANLPVVTTFAKRFGLADATLPDRIQDGSVGLLEAIDRFDPGRGVWLSTYAASWIVHSMTRAMTRNARLVRIPDHVHQLVRRAERARRRLASELGRAPELAEVAAAIGEDPERVERAEQSLRQRTVVPHDAAGEARSIEALVDESPSDPVQAMIARRDRSLALAQWRRLPSRQQDILRHRFGIASAPTLTLEQIGRRHGISRERARQLQVRALGRLRDSIERAHSG